MIIDNDIPELEPATHKRKSWLVYLDNRLVDTVLYRDDIELSAVRRSLITEFGYPREIIVEPEGE